ncbi:hypothetical protein GCM10009677_21250 [Sphaerisporangium rubeum]|uniref:FtsX-like permease family protein n=1 Tax=Sphaerisporangium rubeum TaxID=321317 RepID=UPI0031D85CFD
MLRVLGLRARAQWPLLAALLAVVMVGPTLLGTCALLVTSTAERALETAASRASAADTAVTAYIVTVRGPDARSVAEDTRGLLTSALTPFTTTTATRASSLLRSIPGTGRDGPADVTYLSGMDGLKSRARLTAGRWPSPGAAPLEAVVLESTARMLRLRVGDRVKLGPELTREPAPPTDVTVVGVVRPLPAAGWDRDPLSAAGFDLAYNDGRSGKPVRAYGPFLLDLTDMLAGGSTIDRMEVVAQPDLSAPDRRDLDTVAAAVLGADRRLERILGDRIRIERVASALPGTLLAAREQQQVTTATVLAVALLGSVLTAAALALAGRLVAAVRAGEIALLSAMGVSRGQLAAAAATEAAILAVLATALAIPASSLLHSLLTHLPLMAGAGLAVPPAVTGVQAVTVAAGVLALAVMLVFLAVRPSAAPGERRGRRELLARSGADLLLVVFAAVGWWQLYAQPTGSSARTDAVRVLAPALLLTAGPVLALRLVTPALRGADRLARRARGLVVPLATLEAARRPQAVAAGLLIGLACAACTFGVGFDATWQRSQRDQAALSVGTDLALPLAVPPVTGQGADVAAATGGVVSPATDRGIAVGQWLGDAGEPSRLIAVDATRAGALLRGRLDDGRAWNDVGPALAPPAPVAGVPVPSGATLTMTGTATGHTALAVTPRLLVQDATGLRTPCTGSPVPLDGEPHPLPPCASDTGLEVVAVSLPVMLDSTSPANADRSSWDPLGFGEVTISVTLGVPGSAAKAGEWTATSLQPAPQYLFKQTAAVTGAALKMTATVNLAGPPDAARTLVATAFPDPGAIPVAVTSRFADKLGVRPGSQLSLTVGVFPVQVSIATVLPVIPSAPGAAAVLADIDNLSRALVTAGNFDSPVDAWWVGGPTVRDAAARATALGLGAVTTRAGEEARLSSGPLRAGLPAALRLLVPAAVLLLLTGVILHVTCDVQARALEVARLRGIGMYRREIRTVLLGQHVGILLPLVAAGAAAGALATWVVAPLLVRSDTGAAPLPAALPSWPWAAEAGLVALLLLGCTVAVTAVVTVQARRADVAHLRVAS